MSGLRISYFVKLTYLFSVHEELAEVENDCEILLADELIEVLCGVGVKCDKEREFLVVGFVGYPNVGKSSTLNALCGTKKTSVSATPGKTKHYQVSLSVD